jgi:hypothetical protein
LLPLRILAWPFLKAARFLDSHFVSYLTGRVVRDRSRVYSVKFIWYGDSVYLHPMIWGSLVLYALASAGLVSSGWLLLFWFTGLCLCYVTVMYNFDVIRTAILLVVIAAVMGLAYFATMEFSWNPLRAASSHVRNLDAYVSPGFYLASAYLFTALIACEVLWAWMFHRVQIDESYVYEHRLLSGTSREPIFARGLKRETKDLLEMILLGAADIQHRTKNGFKRFRNVPFASLWLGTAIDSLLDHRRKGEIQLTRKDDDADQARVADALQELDSEEEDDEGSDEGDSDDDSDV